MKQQGLCGLIVSQVAPLGAMVTDLIMNKATPPGGSGLVLANCFLQSWKPLTCGPMAVKLRRDVMRVLKAAGTYNTHLATIRFSEDRRECVATV